MRRDAQPPLTENPYYQHLGGDPEFDQIGHFRNGMVAMEGWAEHETRLGTGQ